MISPKLARKCGRAAALREAFPSAVSTSKHLMLAAAGSQALREIRYDPFVPDAQIHTAVETAMSNAKGMLPWEADAEARRLEDNILRWAAYERKENTWRPLRTDLLRAVTFAGLVWPVRVDALVERPDCVEAIRFRTGAPDLTFAGRKTYSLPEWSVELLLLQLAGQAEYSGEKEVRGAFYHLKARSDTSSARAADYDAKTGQNRIWHHFTLQEANRLERECLALPGSAVLSNPSCKASSCSDCAYLDLCMTRFVPVKHREPESPSGPALPVRIPAFTPAQRAVLSAFRGIFRVNAVAGSGKTTTIAMRTISLLEEGVEPEEILMISFSSKAAAEMKAKILELGNGPCKDECLPVEAVEIQTFNSWGQKLLDRSYPELGFTEPPRVVTDIEKKELVVELLDRHRDLPLDYRNPFLRLNTAKGAVISLCDILDAMRARGIQSDTEIRKAFPAFSGKERELLEICGEYSRRLKEKNLVEYEDQLLYMSRLDLTDCGYRHIVVDEFQDSDPNQIRILKALVQTLPDLESLLVVGDEMQAIYGFRNATPEGLVNFQAWFPVVKDLPLEENFRSGPGIIALANRVVQKISRLGVTIRAAGPQAGGVPRILELEEQKEPAVLAEDIARVIRAGAAPSSIALLAKSRSELAKFQEELTRRGVPCGLRVPHVLKNEPYVKVVLALAAFLDNPEDLVSLALYAMAMGADPFHVPSLERRKKDILDLLERCASEADRLELWSDLTRTFRKDVFGEAFLESLTRFSSFHELIRYCNQYRIYGVEETMQEESDNRGVSLTTIHSAKGLEWDRVYLSLKGLKKYTEEEARLCYVGITRARLELTVSFTPKQGFWKNLLT